MAQVSELLALKITNARQACELFSLKANAELQRLDAVSVALVKEAQAEVGAPDGHVYNLETREFQAPSESSK